MVKIEDIASQEAIPASFLVQILNELKRAELVQSRRGKAGGYLLARPPATISLADLAQVLEPALLEPPAPPKGQSGEPLHASWSEISQSLAEQLRATTLDNLAVSSDSPMYFI